MNKRHPHKPQSIIGQNSVHDSAALQLSGLAKYVDDLPEPPGTLVTYLFCSPHAHANIVSLDISAVKDADGVFAVATAADIPAVNNAGLMALDEPLLAEKTVQYVGQPIFAVAAVSIRAARNAAKLAKIEYQLLTPIFDMDEALAKEHFLSPTMTMQQGDTKKTFEQAAIKQKYHYKLGGQEHFYLEGQVCLSVPEENSCWTVYTSSQHPSEVQHLIARTMGLPDANFAVEVRRLGGGFGGKETQAANFACIATVLSAMTNRPIKLRLDRDDDMIITGKRHPFQAEVEVACNPTGKISALTMDLCANGGFSLDLTDPVVDRAMFHADSAYYIANRTVCGKRLKTNLPSNTAFRGFGGPQGAFFMEQALEDLARVLNKDALDLRYANYYQNGDKTHYGQVVEDSILTELTKKLERTSQYRARKKEISQFNSQNSLIKRGLSLTPVKFGISFTLKEYNQAGALIHVYTDGSIHLNHGGIEMGQGLFTKVAQVVAQTFQVDLQHIRLMATSTAKVPNTSATAASSGSDLNGMAAFDAANQIKQRIVNHLADLYGVDKTKIHFASNQVFIAEKTLSFAEAVQQCKKDRVSLSAAGFYKTPKIYWDRNKMDGRPFYYFAYGACATEAEVDCLTGEYKFLRSDILHDCGSSLNPMIDQGQVVGGFVQGLGWLTIEELVWNNKGELRTHSPSTYKIPTSRDIPFDIRCSLLEKPNKEETIFRSKAVGEPPLILGFSGFFAIKDAIASLAEKGVPVVLDAPATPERVLRAIYQSQKKPWNGSKQ